MSSTITHNTAIEAAELPEQLALSLNNDFTGVTYQLKTSEIDSMGAQGDLMHSGGNVWLTINGVQIGSLWIHQDESGKPILELGTSVNNENGDWEPCSSIPLEFALEQPAEKEHQAIVLPFAGFPPECSCGWKSERFPKEGSLLADHLAEFGVEPTA
ncbi:hypothetical protein GCM10025867_51130 (plasmid) [Frondihabitans sucicola]|uniref:Uncharacterized protein n=1 Tax=Frondihabitans sucicola TaxID=1268041 RepID=A0ABM8GV16_9MICO|nr:hypothetical protein [Frondihabitans sucicola]BDZ52305.1 hypothetical protein GCM10025867_45460 [Frondihabitans sucicola]BDZ52872.1 hypothetical protein GCM10025867_51130 [Frondihabitans sucicola]